MRADHLPGFADHEAVHHVIDPDSGLEAVIAIHDRSLGPALGGCRLRRYKSLDEAASDALRLSAAMTFKNALAGLPFGGGKAVILDEGMLTDAKLLAFGRVVERLEGAYVTAEDMGMDETRMRTIATTTQHVAGLAREGAHGGDPSPFTAAGVVDGMRAAVRHRFGSDSLEGAKVAIQGLGQVGMGMARLLAEAGAELTVADIDPARVEFAMSTLGARACALHVILACETDILAPCAVGGVITVETAREVRARIVAGAANNQLADGHAGRILHERGILYAPDYVVNAGGVISIAHEHAGERSSVAVHEHLAIIRESLGAIFEEADATDTPTATVADGMARAKLRAARAGAVAA